MKIMRVIIFILVTLTSLSAGVKEKMEELLKLSKAPGMNLSFLLKGGTLKEFSAGYADVKNKIEMTPEHLMFSGSIGKTYAVAVIAQLADEGKIDLNKKFIEYFPETKWLKRLPNYDQFTILHLMQHRSGLPRYAFKKEIWDLVKKNPDKIWSYKERLSYVFDDKAFHPAGEGFAYSDTGYLLLGMLIEKITGKYIYEAIYQRIIYPAQLKETFPADRRILPNHSNTYSNEPLFNIHGEVFNNGVCIYNPQMENTGGGWTSTTSDLAKWVKIYVTGKFFSEKMKKVIQTVSEHGKNLKENFQKYWKFYCYWYYWTCWCWKKLSN